MSQKQRDDQKKIHATKGTVGGTGFGLVIAKQSVEARGGTIEVDSGNAGARFTIKVPSLASTVSSR